DVDLRHPPSSPTRRSSDLIADFRLTKTSLPLKTQVKQPILPFHLFVASMHMRPLANHEEKKKVALSNANEEYRYLFTRNLSKKRSEEHTSELQSRFDLVCR